MVHSEILSRLKRKVNQHKLALHMYKTQAVSGLTISRNQTEQYHPQLEGLRLFFLLRNLTLFETSEKTHVVECSGALCLVQIFHCFISATRTAVQHLTCKGSDISLYKNFFTEPDIPLLLIRLFLLKLI